MEKNINTLSFTEDTGDLQIELLQFTKLNDGYLETFLCHK